MEKKVQSKVESEVVNKVEGAKVIFLLKIISTPVEGSDGVGIDIEGCANCEKGMLVDIVSDLLLQDKMLHEMFTRSIELASVKKEAGEESQLMQGAHPLTKTQS